MGLREHASIKQRKSSVCSIEKMRSSHPHLYEEMCELLGEWGINPDITFAGLSRALKTEGVTIRPNTLARHYYRNCECEA